ncbi:type II secretion system F family protein [Burkholderiaceae bacterium DAT-1]|nr:type II secretion system F family protein [Burkholderiaceae bacterium DAT-1]
MTPFLRHSRAAYPVQDEDLAEFCFQLAQLLDAGLPLAQALKLQHDLVVHARWRTAVQQMAAIIESGFPLSDALRRCGLQIPLHCLAVIRAGELSGKLPEALGRLEAVLQQHVAARKHLRKALTYPALVLMVGGGASVFIIGWLLPQLAGMFSAFGSQPPATMRALLSVNEVFRQAPILSCLCLFAPPLCFGMATLLSTRFQRWLGHVLESAPVIGAWRQEWRASHLASQLAMLFESGMPLAECVSVCAHNQSNPELGHSLRQCCVHLENGHPLSLALGRHLRLPSLFIQLIQTGEHTGALLSTLKRAHTYFERRCQQRTDKLIASIEPALTLLLGGIMTGIIAAVMLPVYDLVGKLGG